MGLLLFFSFYVEVNSGVKWNFYKVVMMEGKADRLEGDRARRLEDVALSLSLSIIFGFFIVLLYRIIYVKMINSRHIIIIINFGGV